MYPQGDWLCPSCKAGEPPPLQQTQAVTLRQKLLSQAAGLAVLRIESLHRQLESGGHQKGRKHGNAECEFTFTGRWYCLPEETRHGRQARSGWPLVPAHACNTSIAATDELSIVQLFGTTCGGKMQQVGYLHTGGDAAALWLQAHHNARELFLTQLTDAGLEGATLLRPCAVVACTSELAAAAGDDVFVCDHAYDTAWDVSGCLIDIIKVIVVWTCGDMTPRDCLTVFWMLLQRFRPLQVDDEEGLDGSIASSSDEVQWRGMLQSC
jgi:hypothetical protein